jgi:hypothetical protein
VTEPFLIDRDDRADQNGKFCKPRQRLRQLGGYVRKPLEVVGDWLNPPVIHRVDLRQGQTIRIQVHPDDDVMVTKNYPILISARKKEMV